MSEINRIPSTSTPDDLVQSNELKNWKTLSKGTEDKTNVKKGSKLEDAEVNKASKQQDQHGDPPRPADFDLHEDDVLLGRGKHYDCLAHTSSSSSVVVVQYQPS
jgi:hypothetical protein